MRTKAWGAYAADKPLEEIDIERREVGPHDVQIRIAYCGVCHSDLHQVRSEWGGTLYPCVPGHEIVGHVTALGSEVAGFTVGETVGVGCMVDSCKHCRACNDGLEQYCENGFVPTYNGETADPPGHTLGGYSQDIVVRDAFVLKIRHAEGQLPAVAPLLCAGVTTWSPLRHWEIGPGSRVGVVGIGGLGHLGVKFAHALGAHVVAFTTSPDKRETTLELGADEVVVSTDAEQMAACRGSLDFLLDTVSAVYPMTPVAEALKLDGTLCSVGIPDHFEISPFTMAAKRLSLASSGAGGTRDVREMLEFCAEHGITADVEVVAPTEINTALDRLARGDVRYRFVIDMAA
jgi:uncharacterized zinc-type alcohol dehydrogenase-like protein